MSDEGATAALIGGVALLERAINYTLGSLAAVTDEALARPTPCTAWDLRELLGHLDDSLLALHEAIVVGYVDVDVPDDRGRPADPVAGLRDRACQLLGAWANAERHDTIPVAGRPLTAGLLTSAGAIEVAVHGWDVARSVGQHRPIPASLAGELAELAPFFVTDDDRPGRFAAPVVLPATAGPADRLVAFLGRCP